MTYTIVAFRYNKRTSVLYKNTEEIDELKALIGKALIVLEADVISIRRIHDET